MPGYLLDYIYIYIHTHTKLFAYLYRRTQIPYIFYLLLFP